MAYGIYIEEDWDLECPPNQNPPHRFYVVAPGYERQGPFHPRKAHQWLANEAGRLQGVAATLDDNEAEQNRLRRVAMKLNRPLRVIICKGHRLEMLDKRFGTATGPVFACHHCLIQVPGSWDAENLEPCDRSTQTED